MQIDRSTDVETQKGPADWFTGDVCIAMHQNDETGTSVSWSDHVTDEQHGATP